MTAHKHSLIDSTYIQWGVANTLHFYTFYFSASNMATTYTELLRGYFMVPTFLLMTAVIPLLRSLSLDSQDKFVCDTTCQYELICIAASCFLVIFWCVFGALPWIFWLLPLYAVRSPRDLHTTRDSAAQSSSTGQCSACEQILVKSGLLNGKERHLTRRVEWHSFRNQYLESLRGGQVACQICTLLLERFVPPTDGERSYGTFGSQSRDIEENPYLRIWQPLLEEGATYMQLYWSGNPVSAAFNIQEGTCSFLMGWKWNQLINSVPYRILELLQYRGKSKQKYKRRPSNAESDTLDK